MLLLLSVIYISLWCTNNHEISGRAMNGYAGANARRRVPLDRQGPTVVHQKPGPLQTIFNLLPDEVGWVH